MKPFTLSIIITLLLIHSTYQVNIGKDSDFDQSAYTNINKNLLNKIARVASIGNLDEEDISFSDMNNRIFIFDPRKRGTVAFIYYLHLIFYQTIKSSNDCLIPKIKAIAKDPTEFIKDPKKYLNDYFQDSSLGSLADLDKLAGNKEKILSDKTLFAKVQNAFSEVANDSEEKINDVVLKEINNDFNNFLDNIKYNDSQAYNEILNNTSESVEYIKIMKEIMSNENEKIVDAFISLKVKQALEIGKLKEGFSKVKNFFVGIFKLNDASLDNDSNLALLGSNKTIDQCLRANNPVPKSNTRLLPQNPTQQEIEFMRRQREEQDFKTGLKILGGFLLGIFILLVIKTIIVLVVYIIIAVVIALLIR